MVNLFFIFKDIYINFLFFFELIFYWINQNIFNFILNIKLTYYLDLEKLLLNIFNLTTNDMAWVYKESEKFFNVQYKYINLKEIIKTFFYDNLFLDNKWRIPIFSDLWERRIYGYEVKPPPKKLYIPHPDAEYKPTYNKEKYRHLLRNIDIVDSLWPIKGQKIYILDRINSNDKSFIVREINKKTFARILINMEPNQYIIYFMKGYDFWTVLKKKPCVPIPWYLNGPQNAIKEFTIKEDGFTTKYAFSLFPVSDLWFHKKDYVEDPNYYEFQVLEISTDKPEPKMEDSLSWKLGWGAAYLTGLLSIIAKLYFK